MQKSLIFFFLFTSYFIVYSQGSLPPGTYTSINKKAIKFYEESKKMFQTRKDDDAEKLVKKAIETDPNFIEAYSAYAQLLL